MGAGMGPRMTLVLGAFARARLAGLLEGDDLVEEARGAWMGRPKPSVVEIIAVLERGRSVGQQSTAEFFILGRFSTNCSFTGLRKLPQ
ncbi:hypothetical protein SAMN04488095_1287 [Jannaschia pohangensis]|uniref:Uncharacterized protein n=1 Tax=Jannaschia pohangensis TaxID=390807 RepID=A0A1I3JDJ7_9RHOB|nr:hypothetical protein SAMN04488095_1287 [Jannaschia pohangensis]